MTTETSREPETQGSVSRRGFLGAACVAGAVVAFPLVRHALAAIGSPEAQGIAGLPSPRRDPATRPAAVPTVVEPSAAGAEEAAGGGNVTIIAAKCVGCGKCVRVAGKTFAVNAKTEKAYVKNPAGDSAATISKAAKACPTGAIKVG